MILISFFFYSFLLLNVLFIYYILTYFSIFSNQFYFAHLRTLFFGANLHRKKAFSGVQQKRESDKSSNSPKILL